MKPNTLSDKIKRKKFCLATKILFAETFHLPNFSERFVHRDLWKGSIRYKTQLIHFRRIWCQILWWAKVSSFPAKENVHWKVFPKYLSDKVHSNQIIQFKTSNIRPKNQGKTLFVTRIVFSWHLYRKRTCYYTLRSRPTEWLSHDVVCYQIMHRSQSR